MQLFLGKVIFSRYPVIHLGISRFCVIFNRAAVKVLIPLWTTLLNATAVVKGGPVGFGCRIWPRWPLGSAEIRLYAFSQSVKARFPEWPTVPGKAEAEAVKAGFRQCLLWCKGGLCPHHAVSHFKVGKPSGC